MYRDTARHWHHPWLRIELAIRALVGAYLIYFASHPRLDIHDIRRIDTCMDKEISR